MVSPRRGGHVGGFPLDGGRRCWLRSDVEKRWWFPPDKGKRLWFPPDGGNVGGFVPTGGNVGGFPPTGGNVGGHPPPTAEAEVVFRRGPGGNFGIVFGLMLYQLVFHFVTILVSFLITVFAIFRKNNRTCTSTL